MAEISHRLQSAIADRYRIERELGHGGMATVYLAQDLKHQRLVAIKVLDPELAAVIGADRFLREIEVAARLNHPHILPLHDSGSADGLLYYVLPYAEGGSLRQRLVREGQLSLADAVRIAREVADALDYAHRRGLGLLPEKTDPLPSVPTWPEFLRGCVRYRQSLDEQLPDAPRSERPYER